MAYAGSPPYKDWGSVPGGEQNQLMDMRIQFEQLIGFTINVTNAEMLSMANAKVLTLRDFGKWMAEKGSTGMVNYPWAKYGLDKDQYASTTSIYQAEYKKLTGQDLSATGLSAALNSPQYSQLMTGSQYQEQLTQDANIQKTYGWVKYGMDYSQWNQQKLGMRTELGRDVSDAEASTLLQYNTQARGSSQAVVARVPQQQPTVGAAGIGQSATR